MGWAGTLGVRVADLFYDWNLADKGVKGMVRVAENRIKRILQAKWLSKKADEIQGLRGRGRVLEYHADKVIDEYIRT